MGPLTRTRPPNSSSSSPSTPQRPERRRKRDSLVKLKPERVPLPDTPLQSHSTLNSVSTTSPLSSRKAKPSSSSWLTMLTHSRSWFSYQLSAESTTSHSASSEERQDSESFATPRPLPASPSPMSERKTSLISPTSNPPSPLTSTITLTLEEPGVVVLWELRINT